MLKGLQYSIGKHIYNNKKKKVNRNKQFLSFNNISTIGILFDLYDESTYPLLKDQVNILSDKNKEIIALGFFPGKDFPDKYLLKRKFKFFYFKDLNFFKIPVKPVVQYFIDKEMDLLIDCTLKPKFETNYIVGLSKAKLKVGFYDESRKDLDFMIKYKGKKDLNYLFEQTIHYLEQINN